MTVRCAVAPGDAAPILAEAIAAGGGSLVEVDRAEALVWIDPLDAASLATLLAGATGIRWVQLPFAGVDRFLRVIDGKRLWTSAKGAYAEAVAEHALALALAGLRHLPARARARSWGAPSGRLLRGARVTILGGGGITEALLRLLSPFSVEATVVRRDADRPVTGGAGRVVSIEQLHEALPGADLVVLALALTPATTGIIGAPELELIEHHAWLVNVARGEHIVTAELVAALQAGDIGGAALDVTDPEPLPTDHPLWDLDNCLVTPHVANTWEMALPELAKRVKENVARYVAGEPLLGVVDPVLGY